MQYAVHLVQEVTPSDLVYVVEGTPDDVDLFLARWQEQNPGRYLRCTVTPVTAHTDQGVIPTEHPTPERMLWGPVNVAGLRIAVQDLPGDAPLVVQDRYGMKFEPVQAYPIGSQTGYPSLVLKVRRTAPPNTQWMLP